MMALSTTETQITWDAGSNSKSVAAAGNATSDVFSIDDTTIMAGIQIKADNNSTPAAGDAVRVYAQLTLGDPDADPDSADEYGTGTQDIPLGTLDTNDDDPALRNVEIPAWAKGARLYVVNDAASNGITISAQMREKRSS